MNFTEMKNEKLKYQGEIYWKVNGQFSPEPIYQICRQIGEQSKWRIGMLIRRIR